MSSSTPTTSRMSPTKQQQRQRQQRRISSNSMPLAVGIPQTLPPPATTSGSPYMSPSVSSFNLRSTNSNTPAGGGIGSSNLGKDSGFIDGSTRRRHFGDVDDSSSDSELPQTPKRVIKMKSSLVGLGSPATPSRGPRVLGAIETPSRRGGASSPTKSAGVSPLKGSKSMPKMGGNGDDVSGGDKVVVCVRIKPTSSPKCLEAYNLSPSTSSLSLSPTHPTVIKRNSASVPSSTKNNSTSSSAYTYNFSTLHLPPHPTSDLYESAIAPLVDKAMSGFNSTIFAYGQTGSGKTFTMSGDERELGVVPLAVAGVFEAIEQNPMRKYLLRVSYLEIYNETIRDLLNFSHPSSKSSTTPRKSTSDTHNNEKPTIHVDQSGQVIVRPLVEEIVRMPEEVMKVLHRGDKNRKTAGTDWNDRSSRSHCVFTITIESRDAGDVRRSRLTLIDLAGSEKAASNSERLSEGKYINKSLLALGTVIEQLADRNRKPGSHIPYRNSKLTHLLENAIGGNANVAVICTLSLEEMHQSETLETLKFASRCSQVETKAVKGVVPSSERALLRAKEEEILDLKQQLHNLANERTQEVLTIGPGQREELAEELEEMEARRDRLHAQLMRLNGEILSSQNIGSNPLAGESSTARNRRRVSDITAFGGLPGHISHLSTPSKRTASGFMRTLMEEDDSPRGLEGDFIKAARRNSQHEQAVVESLTQELQEAKRELAGMQALEDELFRTRKQLADQETKQAKMEAELERQREAATGAEVELGLARDEVSALKDQLAVVRRKHNEELAASSPSAPPLDPATRKRLGLPAPKDLFYPSPDALRHSGSLKEYRKVNVDSIPAPYTPSSRLVSREREEIERLETVVKGMKTVNEELLMKIARWRDLMIAQDQVIQKLQQEQLTPKKPAPEQTYALSPSRSINSPVKAPVTPSKWKGHHRSDSASSSSWGLESPQPLPMTASMESKRATPKKRRITIEQDMEKLQSASKVDKTRALFAGSEERGDLPRSAH